MVARMRKAQSGGPSRRRPAFGGSSVALAIVVVVATRAIACGSTVSASHYDQTCQTAADCVAVGVGDPCSTACEEFPEADAISRKSLETYNYDAFSAQYACSHCGSLSGCSGNAALTNSAYCKQGTCTLCDKADPCSCAPQDPSCVDGGPASDGGTDAPAEAAPPADGPSQKDAPAQQDAPASDSASSD
jgi:hypothetical protein